MLIFCLLHTKKKKSFKIVISDLMSYEKCFASRVKQTLFTDFIVLMYLNKYIRKI